jgi:hypothetical protein
MRRFLSPPAALAIALSVAAASTPACSASDSSGAKPVVGKGGGGGQGGAAGEAGGGTAGAGGTLNVGGGEPGGAGGSASGCNGVSATATKLDANVLVLLDMSGTMKDDVNGTSKYAATLNAMSPVLAGLSSDLRMGLVYFGRENGCPVSGCCVRNASNGGPDVPVKTLDQAHKNLLTMWASANGPSDNNSTPTGVALGGAYDILRKSGFDGTYYVLLITDGAENCLGGLPSQAVKYSGDAASGSPPVKTFVVGSPGSDDFRATLSEIAKQGGTARTPACNGQQGSACHYDLTGSGNYQQELQTALNEILGGVSLPCTYAIPPQDGGAFDATQVNVSFTNGSGTQTIPQDTTKACSEAAGWQYSTDQTQIILCGTACQMVQGDPSASINIVFGCPTQTIK